VIITHPPAVDNIFDFIKCRLLQTTIEQVRAIVRMKADVELVATIARTVSVDQTSVHRVLRRVADGNIKVAEAYVKLI
jgi:hypothetical protein